MVRLSGGVGYWVRLLGLVGKAVELRQTWECQEKVAGVERQVDRERESYAWLGESSKSLLVISPPSLASGCFCKGRNCVLVFSERFHGLNSLD